MFEEIFRRRKLVSERLLKYGFEETGGKYCFHTDIMGGEFSLLVTVDENEHVETDLTETDSGEEFTLYKTNAASTYIGDVRNAISDVLADISAKCYQPSVFKNPQTLRLIEHVSETYGDELEFLWEKFPDNAVWRRKDTGKWYGAVLTVAKNKLVGSSSYVAEIVDLRVQPEKLSELLCKEHYYPGWHMNKKSWYTIILEDEIPDEELFQHVRESFELAVK
ncbi:MAG: MmcQ/YjbR family DNA-binding protein [Oscillospiraceae bacterium]|nr:MmcQ/YjbR family DNA-binding protein [Ruminococcus sp.]MCD8346215.1 MmcQ/YjbR family DNA-binding protein [Oscillospiraceae bacterium]